MQDKRTETRELTCINCPMGCRMRVVLSEGEPKVSGNACARGARYAVQECTEPRRMVTAVLGVEGSALPLSVKTREPIPKRDIPACMRELAALTLHAPIRMGDVVLSNVCGSGVDVVATRAVE
ncbi:MAG: DUF1667 domain-containing protein [Clostridia bacterium]|nr:DUF1667 domain-containing protein [Clostridia bacterium]